jgi:hypothetical protein
MILVGVAYRSDSPAVSADPDRRLDRLAAILDPELMEGVISLAKSEGRSETEILNRLLRAGLDRSSHSTSPDQTA